MQNVAAYLAHPFLDMPSERHNFSPHDIKSIYTFLRRNRVILSAMNHGFMEKSNFARKKNLLKGIITSNQLFAEARDFAFYQRERCVELVEAMTESGVDIIFIKSFNEFPLDSHNFDILVKEQDLAVAKQVLENLGFKELIQIREPSKWFYRKVKNNMVVSVHLHIRIAWEGVEFVDSRDVWDKHREIVIEALRTHFPSPEHQLLITAAHAFFENQCLKLCDLLCMVEALRSDKEIDWNYIADWCIQNNWLKAFYAFLKLANYTYKSFYDENLVEEEAFKTLEKKGKLNSFDLGKKLVLQFGERKTLPMKIPITSVAFAFVQKVFRTPQKSFAEKMRKVSSTGWHYIKRRMPFRKDLRALLICFAGQDGTGKTTHAQFLQDELVKMIHVMNDEIIEENFRIRYVWSRGIGLTIDPLLSITRRLLLGSKSANIENYTHKRQRLIKREPIKTLWAYVTLVDEMLQLLTKVKIPLMLRQVIICDRYIYDAFVDVKCNLNKNISSITKRILTKIVPNPEIKFITDADPKEIIKRKEKLELDLFYCKRQSYLDYLQSREFILIDTSKQFERNSQEVMSKVLETLMF
jgi:thymidylate kinase